jgi:hypothetical protein
MHSVVTPYALLNFAASMNAGYRLNCDAPSLANTERPSHMYESILGVSDQRASISVENSKDLWARRRGVVLRCNFGDHRNYITQVYSPA